MGTYIHEGCDHGQTPEYSNLGRRTRVPEGPCINDTRRRVQGGRVKVLLGYIECRLLVL
ncbi:hypothetical protein K438DRAFT_1875482, partial [Mycena galopus ATCC 62051]